MPLLTVNELEQMSFLFRGKVGNALAREIMKMIRTKLKDALKYHREEGVSICLSTSHYVSKSTANSVTPKFKSFSEFLVWSDLNVK